MEAEITLDLFNVNDAPVELVVTFRYRLVDADGYFSTHGRFWDVQTISHKATVKGKHYRITGPDYKDWDREIDQAIEKFLDGRNMEVA